MLETICKQYSLKKEYFLKAFCVIAALSLIYYLPMLQIETGVMDDYDWDVKGLTFSYSNVRPFGTILLSFLYFNPVLDFNKEAFIFSVGPLWQVLSILCLCFASTIFGLWVWGEDKVLEG